MPVMDKVSTRQMTTKIKTQFLLSQVCQTNEVNTQAHRQLLNTVSSTAQVSMREGHLVQP